MTDEILVLDDVYTEQETSFVEDLLFSQKLSWVYFKTVSRGNDHPGALAEKPTPGFGCYIKQERPWFVNQDLFNDTRFIIDKACERINKKWRYLINARAFMLFPLSEKFNVKHQSIHVDLKMPHLVCIYYVNDADGDTIIFDRKYDGTEQTYDSDWKELKRITPKKGRILLFNGLMYHSSSSPKDNVRCIINFDLVV